MKKVLINVILGAVAIIALSVATVMVGSTLYTAFMFSQIL